MTASAGFAGRRGSRGRPAGVLPESRHAAVELASARVPRRRRRRRGDVPVLRNALSPRRRSEGRPLSYVARLRPDVAGRRRSFAASDRVLLIAPSWVGDAILSEPLVARCGAPASAARRRRRAAVVRPGVCAHARHRPHHRQAGCARRVRAGARASARPVVARARYTHAYVLPNTWKSALVPFFARIPVRIGYVGEARYGLLTDARRLDRKAAAATRRRATRRSPATARPCARCRRAPQLVPDARKPRAAMRALATVERAAASRSCVPAPNSVRPSAGRRAFRGAGAAPRARWIAIWIARLARTTARSRQRSSPPCRHRRRRSSTSPAARTSARRST